MDSLVGIDWINVFGEPSLTLGRDACDKQDSSIIVVLDKQPTHKGNPFLLHKTTEREVYNEARQRNGKVLVQKTLGLVIMEAAITRPSFPL